jgi:hypothetical protein
MPELTLNPSVGSSIINMLALSIIILDIIQRIFSPPDNTLQVFNASFLRKSFYQGSYEY